MRSVRISPFKINQELLFKGALAFLSGDRALLIEKEGHIILMDQATCADLIQKKIPLGYINVLKNRIFITDRNDEKVCLREIAVRPEFFMIDMTNRCNMRCSYCLRNVKKGNESISDDVLLDICKYIERYCNIEGLPHVSVQAWGGEPLLEKKKLYMLRNQIKTEKTKVHISIETNATLLDPEVTKRLYREHIGIGISIDGMQEKHDQQRYMASGAPSYQKVAENLLQAKKLYGDHIGTITTVTRNNADKIEEILNHFAVNLQLTNVKFNFVHKSTFTQCENLCLSNEEIAETEKRILSQIVKLQEQGYPIMEHNIFIKLKNILFREYSDICLSCGCCGGRKMVVFDMYGNIYPCELTDNPQYKLGSIYETRDLREILNDAIETKNRYFVEKTCIDCDGCYWQYFCRGGCTIRVLSNGQVPPEPDMIECSVNKSIYPELIKLILEKPELVNKMMGWSVLEEG